MLKGSFFDYVDQILLIIDHEVNGHIVDISGTTYPPVNLVKERPLGVLT